MSTRGVIARGIARAIDKIHPVYWKRLLVIMAYVFFIGVPVAVFWGIVTGVIYQK